nr:unnamed protein product [Callosobruchus analis]
MKNNLDIIVLSETGEVKDKSNFSIPDYNMYYNESHLNKCDGVVVYVKHSISVIESIVQVNDFKFLRVTLLTPSMDSIGLTAIYRPPSTNIREYIDSLEQYLDNIRTLSMEIYLGDINIDLMKKDSVDTISYFSVLGSKGFVSFINKPTRVTKESQTIIDHIFLRTQKGKNQNVATESIIFNTDMTDHYSPCLFLSCRKKYNVPENNYKTYIINYGTLKDVIKAEMWEDVTACDDSQTAYSKFIDKLNHYIDQTTQLTHTTNKQFKKIKPWITAGLMTSIRHRDSLKKHLLKNHSLELEQRYKEYRNKTHALIRKTKNLYYENKITEAGNDYKKLWDVINDISGQKNKNSKQLENLTVCREGGELINDNLEKAETFNNFFTNIGSNMAQKIPKENLPKNFLEDVSIKTSIFLNPITKNEIIQYISKLKNKCSPGLDKITAKTIKTIHQHILSPLLHIINLSFSTGKIPSQWKESVIAPVHKSGDSAQLSNYRPISVINNFAKIFEQAIKHRLIDFFHRHKILGDHQYGFIQNSNTENAVTDLLEHTLGAMDESSKCVAVFLDIAKAFDTVSHEKILNKLYNYGIRGIAYELMSDYLNNRTQRVKIGNKLSNRSLIKTGIPQGTVLGPILFLVYINSLAKISKLEGHLICYADDTALMFKADSWEKVTSSVESDMKKIKIWLNDNLLTLNSEKTKYIAFSPTAADHPSNISLKIHASNCHEGVTCNCPRMEKVSSLKYLGVILDQHLKWNAHIIHVSNRLRCLTHRFYVLRDILSKNHVV